VSHAKIGFHSTYGVVSGFHGSNNSGFASSDNSIGHQLFPEEERYHFQLH